MPQASAASPRFFRPILTTRGSGLEFGVEMDLARGSVTRKSVPEPIWPRSGNVADHIKVFNERYLLNDRSSDSTSTTLEIKAGNSGTSANTAAHTSTTDISPATKTISVSANPEAETSPTSIRSDPLDSFMESGNVRTKSGFRRLASQFQPTREMFPIGECPSFDETEDQRKTPPGHNDSIVTEALLRMTDTTVAATSNQESLSSIPVDDVADIESPRRTEDMDNVIRELTIAVMKSKNVSTLTRALKSTQKVHPSEENLFSETGLIFLKEKLSGKSSSSSAATTGRFRSSFRALKLRSSRSADAMKDLWKQTGMKTNGRKLLAGDNDDETITCDDRRHSHQRRRRKRACRVHRCVHGTSSSSQSSHSPKFSLHSDSYACSDSSPQYVGVASQKKPLAYSSSTEVYAEVYDEESEMQKISSVRTKSSPAYYRRPIANSDTVDLDDIDAGTTTTCYSRSNSSASSSPKLSRENSFDRTCSIQSSKIRKSSAMNKRVQFKNDVLDNEYTGKRLIYERVVRTSPPKSSAISSPIVIDINKLSSESYGYSHSNSSWETYYGTTNFLSERAARAKSSKFGDAYRSVFTSPYFDYRKTHSKSGSIYGSSDLILDSTQSRLLQQRKILMREEKRKRFWKSFAILLSVLLVAAIVVALSIYITHGRSTIVRTS